MTPPNDTTGTRRGSAARLLAGLAVVAVVVAILTPEPPGDSSGGRSSYSTGPGGVRMAYELAQRLGWQVHRRLTTLDSLPPAGDVQVVLAPSGGLGGHEVHRLLDNVRAGGGLVFSLDGNDEIADSLGLDFGKRVAVLGGTRDPECEAPQSIAARVLLTLPPEVNDVVWRKRPLARDTTLAVVRDPASKPVNAAIGFPLGAGRVAVTSSSAIFSNDAVRNCPWKADLAVVSMLEYVRPRGGRAQALAFDEFHHGFGTHGGTLRAAAGYLAHTPSGHFVIQALVAGLLLLLAKAPRPILPRDVRAASRRSPLEHADALGRAYADVGATRTATARLVAGLRRRLTRWVPVAAAAGDDVFLDAIARRAPAQATDVEVLRRALAQPMPSRELASVGDSLTRLEQAVQSSQSPTS